MIIVFNVDDVEKFAGVRGNVPFVIFFPPYVIDFTL